MPLSYSVTTHPFLTRLQALKFSQPYTPIAKSRIPAELIDSFYEILDLTEGDCGYPLTVKANSAGGFEALYSPMVMRSPTTGGLVVRVGKELYPVPNDVSLLVEGEPNKPPTALALSRKRKVVCLPLAVIKDCTLDARAFNQKLELLENYLVIAGTSDYLPIAKITDLIPERVYTVISYKLIETPFETVYLTAKLNEDVTLPVYADGIVANRDFQAGDKIDIRGNTKLLNFFKAQPTVTENYPAYLHLESIKRLSSGNNMAIVKVELTSAEAWEDEMEPALVF